MFKRPTSVPNTTAGNYLCGHLIHPAENVSVVLLEAPHSGQTGKCA